MRTMPFVSLTRLRIRRFHYVPLFAVRAFRSVQQLRRAPGFHIGSLLADRRRTFWTMTIWDSQVNMRQFMTTGAHHKAMPHLLNWCDEASVAHWEQDELAIPSWLDAAQRMRTSGRVSKVLNPSPRHAALEFEDPSKAAGNIIRPAQPS